MARTTGTLLNGTDAYAGLSFAPTVDLRLGGQQGYIPDYRTYISNSAYVQRNMIAVLVEYPRGFDYMTPDPSLNDIYIGTLKALVEQQAKTIDGVNGRINVSYVDNPIGASGEVQADFSQTTREASKPSFTWVEKQGRPIHLFFNSWIFYLLGHPDTQTPAITSLEHNRGKNFDFLPDFNSMSVLFIEPDPFQNRVVEAWLCVNMMPNGSGDLNGKRDIASAMQSREVQVEFTAMTMMSMGVNQFAQSILDELNYVGLNPHNRRSSIESISRFIRDVKDSNNEEVGYVHQVDHVATTQNVMSSQYPDYSSQAQSEKAGPGGKPQYNPAWVLSQGNDR